MSTTAFLFAIFVALGLRIWLPMSKNLQSHLEQRVEISTPANSLKRVLEGISLQNEGLSPYEGDVFHEVPAILSFVHHLVTYLSGLLPFVFAFLDLCTALCLGKAAELYLRSWVAPVDVPQINKGGQMDKQTVKEQMDWYRLCIRRPRAAFELVALGYLFNPYSIVSCVAETTSVFQNTMIAMTLVFMLSKNRVLCLLALSLAAYQGLYSAILCLPVALAFSRTTIQRKKKITRWPVFCGVIAVFIAMWVGWVYLGYISQGSWDFLDSSYGFLLSVPDLTPNIGLFWYFFTEMFDHFRLFFLWVFQLNVVIYLTPLAICLRSHFAISLSNFFLHFKLCSDQGQGRSQVFGIGGTQNIFKADQKRLSKGR